MPEELAEGKLAYKRSAKLSSFKKNVGVELTPEEEKEVGGILTGTDRTIAQEKPPEAKWLNYCKSCAYRELCWG